MSETGHGEISPAGRVATGPSVRSRIARIAGTIGVATTLGLGLDQGKAHADDPPKTPTPTASPTPDATRTAKEAIAKDLDEKIKQAKERVKQEEEKKASDKALDDKIAADKATLNALTTPTVSPTPDSAMQALIDQEIARRSGRDMSQAQATPIPPTATPGPGEQGGEDPTPQSTSGAVTGSGSGGFDFGKLGEFAGEHWVKGLLGGAGLLGLGFVAKKEIPAALRAVRKRPPLPRTTGRGI